MVGKRTRGFRGGGLHKRMCCHCWCHQVGALGLCTGLSCASMCGALVGTAVSLSTALGVDRPGVTAVMVSGCALTDQVSQQYGSASAGLSLAMWRVVNMPSAVSATSCCSRYFSSCRLWCGRGGCCGWKRGGYWRGTAAATAASSSTNNSNAAAAPAAAGKMGCIGGALRRAAAVLCID